MSFARVHSAQATPLSIDTISVEADISRGLHTFTIVGLPGKAVEESRFRVSAAIKGTGFHSPKSQNHKITISLTPADLKKESPLFDVPIALAYLLAAEEIKFDSKKKIFVGELSLDGTIQKVHGILAIVKYAQEQGFTEIFVPDANKEEAALIPGITIYAPKNLRVLIDHLIGAVLLQPIPQTEIIDEPTRDEFDFAYIQGQELAKRALEIAAAGGHNIALFGPPGTGKTMLARSFTTILPRLPLEEILEVTSLYSTAKSLQGGSITQPPLRSPHHSTSYVALVGGGNTVRPGEVSLAHRGVLFLDEFPEFDRRALEALRQPLEDGYIDIARAHGSARFPATFILIAAMNPCPCGYKNSKERKCICRDADFIKYGRKISGPIIDRIDLWVPVEHIEYSKLIQNTKTGESSLDIKKRIEKVRSTQLTRFAGTKTKTNSRIATKDLDRFATLSQQGKDVLTKSAQQLKLSPRAYYKVIKIARTIADLDNKEIIDTPHILEALQYRPKHE